MLTAVALWTGVRENYIAELKKAMKAALDEVEWDDEDSDEIRQTKRHIENAETIGELFEIMRASARDIRQAVEFALRVVVDDCRDNEFDEVPLRDWDT